MNSTFNVIICIGNGSTLSDDQAKDIAIQHNIEHHGFLNNDTEIIPGCYHTSIYDIKLPELSNKIAGIDNLKIVVLDHDESYYNNSREFYDTLEMAHTLADQYLVEFVNTAMFNPFKQIVKENKSFCILPFISINNNNSHCCWMKKIDNYTEFYTDPTSIKIREFHLSGKKIDLCQYCYNTEEHGAMSPRQVQTRDWTYKLNLKSYDDVIKNTSLIKYEISLGNYCNLQCRMCHPNASSLIDNEYANLGLSDNRLGIIKSNNLDIVDLDAVQFLEIAGGEPSINQDFYNFLKRCIQANKTDFKMYISTNAVSITKEFVSLIKNFSNISLAISVDGFDQTNQYIRWPSNWEKFKQNVQKLIEVIPPRNYHFNTAVSIYNISQLYPLFEFLENSYPTSAFSLHYVEKPSNQQAWNFPNKKLALDNLNKIKTLKVYRNDEVFNSKINGIIHRIETSTVDFSALAEFFKFNDLLDQSRNVRLIDYIPELESCRSYLLDTAG